MKTRGFHSACWNGVQIHLHDLQPLLLQQSFNRNWLKQLLFRLITHLASCGYCSEYAGTLNSKWYYSTHFLQLQFLINPSRKNFHHQAHFPSTLVFLNDGFLLHNECCKRKSGLQSNSKIKFILYATLLKYEVSRNIIKLATFGVCITPFTSNTNQPLDSSVQVN